VGIGRVIVIVAIAWFAFTLYRRYRRRPRAVIKDAKLIRCGVCGIYLPQAEATALPDGEFRCSQHAKE
jgi:hypothetical protein